MRLACVDYITRIPAPPLDDDEPQASNDKPPDDEDDLPPRQMGLWE